MEADEEQNFIDGIEVDEQKGQEQVDPDKSKGMTKSQMKKLIKKQKWQREKLVKRHEKREKEKLKKKEKKLKAAQQKEKQQEQNPDKIKEIKELEQQYALMRKRKQDYVQKMKEGVPVVIDLQFYDKMTQKEQNSLLKQLSHCHSSNRKSQKCFNYILTSATKQIQQMFAKKYNVDKWGISIHQESIEEVFPIQKLVYLTGDAQSEVQELDPQSVYIIGGIVDHNRLKKITLDYANQKGIAARRLPMHGVKLKASVHLAVNHVWQWMLKSCNGATWDQALKAVLPMRKLQTYTEQ